uniref:Putative nonribosomal peptide synthetase n=1 Tax=Moniliophthora roreri TaxID=221103 RepID=A0A0W0ETF4_MONRR
MDHHRFEDAIPQRIANDSRLEHVYPATVIQRNSLRLSRRLQPLGRICTSSHHLFLPPNTDLVHLKESWDSLVSELALLRTGFLHGQPEESLSEVIALVYRPGQEPTGGWTEAIGAVPQPDTEIDHAMSFDPLCGDVPLAILITGNKIAGYHLRLHLHHALGDNGSGKSIIQSLYLRYTNRVSSSATLNRLPGTKIIEYANPNGTYMIRPETTWPPVKVGQLSQEVSWASLSRTCSLSSSGPGSDRKFIRAALGITMLLHSGQDDHTFLESVSHRALQRDGLQREYGPHLTSVLVRLNCASSSTLDDILGLSEPIQDQLYLPMASHNAAEAETTVSLLTSVVHLVVRSSLESVEDGDIYGWQVLDQWTETGSPVQVEVFPSPDGSASVRIRYNASAIQNSFDVSAFADHFASLIEILSHRPELSRVSDALKLVAESDKERTLQFGAGQDKHESTVLSSLLAHERFDNRAHEAPSDIALDFEGVSSMTYGELASRSSHLASVLREKGVSADVMVPILFNVSFDMIIALLAVMKAGGAYVPLAPDYPRARWESVLRTAGSKLLLCGTDIACREDIKELQKTFPHLTIITYSYETTGPMPDPSVISLSNVVTEQDLAYVFFTSGSTGVPKGVAVEHRNLCAFLDGKAGNAMSTPRMRKLLFASYTFDVSVGDIFSTLTTGGTLALVRREELLSNLPYWLDVMKPTHLGVTPSVARQVPVQGLPHLTHVLLNGETFPVELALRLSKTRQVYNIMGPTEATVDATAYKIPMSSGTGDFNPFGERVPIGYPTGQTKVYIFRVGTLDLVARDEVGEICIGGPQVARGYIGQEELTPVKFVPDPFSATGERMFRTGDLGKWNLFGQLDHLGRIDGQVKLRGLRIETGEIEYVVHKSNAAIQAVYADVVRFGEEQLLVGAFTLSSIDDGIKNQLVDDHTWVIPRSQDEVVRVIQDVNEACQRFLPAYMKPAVWLCVTGFPTSISGKTDRSILRRKVEEHLSTNSSIVPPISQRRAPATSSENALAKLVAESLNLGVQDINLNLSFLAQGGNSLQGMVLAANLRAQGLQVNIVDILDDRITLADIAEQLTPNTTSANESPELANLESKPYSPFALAPNGWQASVESVNLNIDDVLDVYPVDIGARDWARLALSNRGRCLIIHFVYDLGGDLDPQRFIWSWEQLRIREPSLRTVLVDVGLDDKQRLKAEKRVPFSDSQGVVAVVLRPGIENRSPPFEVLNASNAQEAQSLIDKMFGDHGLELGIVPIHNLLVFNEADKKWLFASSRQHSLHDLRTLSMQAEELSQLYFSGEAAFSAIERKRTTATSYGAYMQEIHSPARQALGRSFWERYLDGAAPAVWPSPSDVPLSFCKDFSGYGTYISQWVGSLSQLAAKTGVTRGSLVRTAYAVAMAEKQSRDDVILYELVDGLSGINMDPYGFCVHYQPTRLRSFPRKEGESNAERYIRIARHCHRSYSETLPHRASGCEIGAELLGTQCEPGHHFVTSLLNLFDNTQDPRSTTENNEASQNPEMLAFQGKLSVPVQVSYGDINTPLALQVFISDQATVFMCLHDLSIVSHTEMEQFVQRQIDVFTELASIA